MTVLVLRTMRSIAKSPLLPEANVRLFAFVSRSVLAAGSKGEDAEQGSPPLSLVRHTC